MSLLAKAPVSTTTSPAGFLIYLFDNPTPLGCWFINSFVAFHFFSFLFSVRGRKNNLRQHDYDYVLEFPNTIEFGYIIHGYILQFPPVWSSSRSSSSFLSGRVSLLFFVFFFNSREQSRWREALAKKKRNGNVASLSAFNLDRTWLGLTRVFVSLLRRHY